MTEQEIAKLTEPSFSMVLQAKVAYYEWCKTHTDYPPFDVVQAIPYQKTVIIVKAGWRALLVIQGRVSYAVRSPRSPDHDTA
jgi:hypothetical protein